jgi:hypothetical protein
MNKPPSERPGKGWRPKRRGLDEFALPGGGSAVAPPTGARVLVPIQPTEAGGRDEGSWAPAKIRRVKITPALLNANQPMAAGEVQHATEVHGSVLSRLGIVTSEATGAGAATGQSATQELLLDTSPPSNNGNVFTAASAVAEYNERTLKLVIDTAVTTFELTHSLMKVKGPIEFASLTANHIQTVLELMIQHTANLGSIARRLG